MAGKVLQKKMARKGSAPSKNGPARAKGPARKPSSQKNIVQMGSLREIDPALVGSEDFLPFSIYGRSDSESEVSLLLPRGSRFSQTIRRKIDKQYQGKIYILTKDWEYFFKQADKSIKQLIQDNTKDIQEKSAAFYSYATKSLNEIFNRISEERGKNIMLVQPVATHALELVQQDWKATFSLLKLAHSEPQTYSHSLNVCFFGLSYVHNFLPKYSAKDLKEIALGFLSHDIGELMISEKLMSRIREQTLTSLERQVIQQVPLYGCQILKDAQCDYPLTVDIALNHHERVDGTGYPRRLVKHNIPVLARVCAVCETFDDLTNPQSQQPKRLSAFEALRVMLHEQDGGLDPGILVKFVKMMGGNP
jgi:HD-GYP domain-containing protein (c-di-GMP phosphodiesterase class II)